MSDFFLPVVLSARAENPVVAAFQQLMSKAQQTLPWLPNLSSESASLFYGDPPRFPRLNRIPEGLDETQQKQWLMVYDATKALTTAALRGEMQAAQVQSEQLANDVAFWNTVYRITADVATLGVNELWDEFWNAVAACKASRDGIVASLQAADAALSEQGENADPSLVAQQAELQRRLNSLINQIVSIIAPLGPDVRQQAGLGTALVVAGITGAVVVTVTASVWAVAHELAAVQEQANEHAQSVLDHQTAFDEAALAAGQIDQAEFARRRAATAQQAKDIANAQGAGAVGSGLMKAGVGVALAVGAVAAAFFFLKKKSATAPSTNPRRRR